MKKLWIQCSALIKFTIFTASLRTAFKSAELSLLPVFFCEGYSEHVLQVELLVLFFYNSSMNFYHCTCVIYTNAYTFLSINSIFLYMMVIAHRITYLHQCIAIFISKITQELCHTCNTSSFIYLYQKMFAALQVSESFTFKPYQ